MLNPIIYVTFHQDFRRAFKYLLCLQCHSMSSRLRAEAYLSQYGTNKNKITTDPIRLEDNNNNKGPYDNNDNEYYESSYNINVNCHKIKSKAANSANPSIDSLSSFSHSSISHDNIHHHHKHAVFSSAMQNQSKPVGQNEYGQMTDTITFCTDENKNRKTFEKQIKSEKKNEDDFEGATMLTNTTTTTNATINC